MRVCASSLVLVVLLACSSAPPPLPAPPPLDFVERVIGADADRELPMLIALHGLGDRPEKVLTLCDGFDVPLRIVAPRAPDPHSVNTSWYPIDDPAHAAERTLRSTERVLLLSEQLRTRYRTRGLPLVTGFSQGGVLSYTLAAYHADRFAGALPIAGFLFPGKAAVQRARGGFRVTALHGQLDARIPYARGEQAVEALRAAGTEASLTVFPGVGHAVSVEMQQRLFSELRRALTRL